MAAFCRERKLCASHFFWWKKRLGASAAAKFVEVKLAAAAPAPGAVGDPAGGSGTEEWPESPGGTRIRPGVGADAGGGAGERGMRGLPSLRALDEEAAGVPRVRMWLASEATDMRCGFDRLAERVRAVIGQDPLSGHWFIFRSRRGDRLKILTWDQDGFILWYKRLEAGVFKLPRTESGARSRELRASELAMILDGIDVSRLERVRRYERPVG